MNKIKIILFILLFSGLFFFWNRLMIIDKDLSTPEVKGQEVDYILLGSSHIYRGINPLEIWSKEGYTGYVLGTDLQIPQMSYFCLEKYLQQESTPEVVFFDFYGFTLEGGNPSYNLETASRYPLSIEKIKLIQSVETKERLPMYFPFLQFHSRWNQLTRQDFLSKKNNGTFNLMGYLPSYEIYDASESEMYLEGEVSSDYIPEEKLLQEFSKIKSLCDEYGIDLVVIKTPALDWTQAIHDAVTKYFIEPFDVSFIDFNMLYKEIGIDSSMDFADPYHLNVWGAKKTSDYLADYMKRTYTFSDKRGSSQAELWNKKYQEFLHYGEIVSAKNYKDVEEYMKNYKNPQMVIMITEKKEKEVSLQIIRNGEILFESSSPNHVQHRFSLDGRNFYMESTREVGKKTSKIQVDFQNYSLGENGKNIVVYDVLFHTVISRVFFQ